ncbi:PepSY domain-containing protein [Microbacterium immunditiarum]|uniref:Putative membrane protein YkoI n=1 Tax=Microbacterium immunditiarum TaxID=337480 RepID=A0A7Y9GMQ3_9MICO|nr:PepSY domain-containing protein [Microbacterium immunditiarum]NYE19257.1 putative membrane protein YkoI [Microbacterium immunditiarum]
MNKRTIGITAAAIAGTAVLAGGAAIAFAAGSAPTPATSLAGTPTPASNSPSPSPSASFDDDRVAAADIDRAIRAALDAAGPGTVLEADTDDDASHAYEIDILLDAGGVVEVKLDDAFQVVSVAPDDRGGDRDGRDDGRGRDDGFDDSDDDDELLTDAARVHAASAAALAHVGSGRVVSVELSDDADHVYEVEIEFDNGDDVDVELDASFNVVRAD